MHTEVICTVVQGFSDLRNKTFASLATISNTTENIQNSYAAQNNIANLFYNDCRVFPLFVLAGMFLWDSWSNIISEEFQLIQTDLQIGTYLILN